MTYEIPGTALSAVQEMANKANAAAEAAAPSISSVVNGLKPGGASLPSITSMLAPLQAAPVPIPGLAEVQKTLETAQANIGLYLNVIQAHVTETIKSAVRDGASQLPDPNTIASSVIPNLFAPLLQAQSFISGIVSNSLPSIAAALAAGGPNAMANAQAAAASVGSSLTSGINGFANQAKGQISEIVAPLKAQTTALMTTGPIATLPSVSSVVSSVGITPPDPYRTFRKLTSPVSMPQPTTATAADPAATPRGAVDGAPRDEPATADKFIPDSDMHRLKTERVAAWDNVRSVLGAPAGCSIETIQEYNNNYVNSLLTPAQQETRSKARAIESTKPANSDRTDEEKAIVAEYEDIHQRLIFSGKLNTLLAAKKRVKDAMEWHDEAWPIWSKGGSKYSLTISLQKHLGYIS